MEELDFTIELNSDYLDKDVELALFTEAEARLRRLTEGHSDMRGAAINLRLPAHGETAPLHEATVVVYARPENVAATKKEDNPQLALQNALDAVEKQIRKRRTKLKKRWEQPGNKPVEQEVQEVIAAEAADDDLEQ